MTSFFNPYTDTARHPGDSHEFFIGRTEILREISEFLHDPSAHALVVCGMPGIGKTALLRRIAAVMKNSSFLPVYFAPKTGEKPDADQVLAQLAKTIAQSLHISGITIGESLSSQMFLARFIPGLVSVLPEHSCLVLLIDTFSGSDPLISRQIEESFYTCLGQIPVQSSGRIRLIPAIGRRTRDTALTALFGNAKVTGIPLFSREETAALVRISEQNDSLKWPDTQVAAVRNFTAGHPGLICCLCSEIWKELCKNRQNRSPGVSFRDMGQGFTRALAQAEDLFADIWESLGIWERVIVSALAEAGNRFVEAETLKNRVRGFACFSRDGILGEITEKFCAWGLAEAKNSGYRIRINMLCRWITARKPFDRIQDELIREADRRYELAYEQYKNGESDPAVRNLQTAYQIRGDSPKIVSLLIRVLIRQKKTGEVIDFAQSLPASLSGRVRPLVVQALLLHAEKEQENEARMALYTKVLETDPANPQARARLRKTAEAEGDRLAENNLLSEALSFYQLAGADIKARSLEDAIAQVRMAAVISHRNHGEKIRKRLVVWVFIPVFFLCVIAFALYAGYRHISYDLPRISTLADYRPPEVTSVYAANMQKIGEFYRERRIVIPLSEMSETLIQAFVAAEDARYFSHPGLDFIGIARAFFKNIEAGEVVQGGSTITQQVIKSFLLGSERSYERKCKEAVLAYRISKSFSQRHESG